jgi:Zn-dependent protease with chaperone function
MNYPNESRVLTCARCGAGNRIPLERALRTPGGLRCGRCKSPLLLEREARWIAPATDAPGAAAGASYQHPLDRDALAAVQQIPGVDSVLKKLIENTYERYDRLFHLSSFIRASDTQLRTLHRLMERAAFALGIDALPDLFLYADAVPNARTGGVERPYVAVSTGLVDMMDDAEVGAVLAHELAHWQCRHVLYKTATQLLVGAASAIATATLGLGSLIVVPLKLALLRWDRCSELSADRGMLLATRDPELSLRVLFKLAGGSLRLREELSLDHFLDQAEQARQTSQEGVLDKVFSLLQTLYRTHPFPLFRAGELWRWACDGEYLGLIQAR